MRRIRSQVERGVSPRELDGLRELAERLEQEVHGPDSAQALDAVACAYYALCVAGGDIHSARWVIARSLAAADEQSEQRDGFQGGGELLDDPVLVREFGLLEGELQIARAQSDLGE